MKTNAIAPEEYRAPELPATLHRVEVPAVVATPESLHGYGVLVDDPEGCPIEIVTWPQPGWRALDPGTGNEGGTTRGEFEVWWEGDVMLGKNHAVVSNEYLFGWSCDPRRARRDAASNGRSRVLLWHANYHPDGGQLFFPRDGRSFICPLALPGEDVRPVDFTAFHVPAGHGLYIHPNVWHETVIPLTDRAIFDDEQGKVHARISCNLAREFGVLLDVALNPVIAA
jgi:hypothetical protein